MTERFSLEFDVVVTVAWALIDSARQPSIGGCAVPSADSPTPASEPRAKWRAASTQRMGRRVGTQQARLFTSTYVQSYVVKDSGLPTVTLSKC